MGLRRLQVEKLFYDDICGPCNSTGPSFKDPSQTGSARSFCEIFGRSMQNQAVTAARNDRIDLEHLAKQEVPRACT